MKCLAYNEQRYPSGFYYIVCSSYHLWSYKCPSQGSRHISLFLKYIDFSHSRQHNTNHIHDACHNSSIKKIPFQCYNYYLALRYLQSHDESRYCDE